MSALVLYGALAEIIAQYAPTKDSQKRLAKAHKLVGKGRKKAWTLAGIWGLDMTQVCSMGQ